MKFSRNITKIIVTLGPSTGTREMIKALAEAGADGFRINFSHGNTEIWEKYASYVLSVEEELKRPLALIGDLQGPNPRIGNLRREPFTFKKGEKVKFVYEKESDGSEVPIPYKEFFELITPGDKIIMADGSISFNVESSEGSEAYAIAEMEGSLYSRKSFSIKGKHLKLPYVTEHDKESLKIAASMGFSHIMASIVESSANILELKQTISRYFSSMPEIYSKIETEKGYENLDYIINESDGIVVARGDLGSHFPMEALPKIQREIVQKTRKAGKPVIIATQLLTSMLNSQTPTRSEIVDIYNSVIEGADALMLTNETAIGNYPLQAVRWLREASREAISLYEEKRFLYKDDTFNRFAHGLTSLSESLKGKILLYTKSGLTGKIISQYRPKGGFFVGVPNIRAARSLSILWGANPVLINAESYDEGLVKMREELLSSGDIKKGDIVIETYRFKEGEIHSIRIFYVS
ncbi:MAG: pyruvate kinase [Fervidicoccaceae archaeon]